MHKTYRTSVKLSLPVEKGGEVLFCEFSDEKHSFNTMDEEVQSYIENTPMFKRGEITLFSFYEVEEKEELVDELEDETTEALKPSLNTPIEELKELVEDETKELVDEIIETLTDDTKDPIEEVKEITDLKEEPQLTNFPDVVNIQEASEILRKEPFRIHYSKTKTPDDILEQARLLNISFPNLILPL